MNSITIATQTTRMEIRLQTAVIQASKKGSDPKAITVRLSWGSGRGGASTLLLSTPTPIHLYIPGFLKALTCREADTHPCLELERPGRGVGVRAMSRAFCGLSFVPHPSVDSRRIPFRILSAE